MHRCRAWSRRWLLSVAAALLVAAAAGCGGGRLSRLPWTRAQGLRVGEVGWWNHALLGAPALARALGSALRAAPGRCGGAPPAEGYTVSLVLAGGRVLPPLVWRAPSLWWRGCAYTVPAAAVWLLRGAVAQARWDWSGRLIPWQRVNVLFPVGARATVTDWATGRSVRVVRWGGRLHADVEPITAADAVALRAIYGGSWSWARRAVVVTLPDGLRVAGSMNGMPHGGGRVAANAFPGHFCLHFLGSEVHRSGRIDEAHLLAILTAAGATVGDGPWGLPDDGSVAAQGPSGGPVSATCS